MSKLYVKYLWGVLLALLSLNSMSQNIESILKVGDDLFEAKDYYGSIQFYKKALEIDSTNATVLFKYGRNLSVIHDNKGASRYFQKALLIDKGIQYPVLNYFLAEALRSSGEYRKSKRYYSKAIIPYRKDRNSYWYRRITQSKKSAVWASQNNTQAIAKPNNLGKSVNSNFSEFGSTIHKGNFYFSAMVADSVEENNWIKDKHYFSRIFVKSTSDYKEAIPLSMDEAAQMEFLNMHLANPTFYENELYFSVCDSNFKCNIWKSELSDNQIIKPIKLNKNINNPSSNNTQPNLAIINDQLHLFFVSDRERGIGGLDIWMSKKESFGFDEAINLGTTINTPDNELSPFYDLKSENLFFSSDWHTGFGGYDIFRSKGKPSLFQEPENLGYGINTHSNEFYFEPVGKGATFTSNRKEGNIEKSSSCCNDLYEVTYITDSLPEVDSSKIVVNEIVLNKYLPLDLFFHNDQPNPNTRDTTTKEVYTDLSQAYEVLEEEYLKKYPSILSSKIKEQAKAELETFFESELREGVRELEFFTPLLLKELQKGSKVVLTIKGFASSISETSYNLNLTLRRIQSLINYFKTYQAGVFIPYLDNTAADGGQLIINKVPFGEFAVKQAIDNNNKIMAIYSPQAARERKIELVALSSSDPKSSLNTEKQAIILVSTDGNELVITNNGETVSRAFNISNPGESDLILYSVSSNCECITLDYPKTIPPGEEGILDVTISTTELKGDVNIELLVVSNTINNLKKLSFKLQVNK